MTSIACFKVKVLPNNTSSMAALYWVMGRPEHFLGPDKEKVARTM